MSRTSRLSVGDWLWFLDEAHQLIGITNGTLFRLRSTTGVTQVVPMGEVYSSDGFGKLKARPAGSVADPAPTELALTGADDVAAWAAVQDTDAVRADRVAILDTLPPAERERVAAIENTVLWMRGMAEEGPTAASGNKNDRVEVAAERLGVSVRQMWRYDAAYGPDNNVLALLDQRRQRVRNPLAGLDPRLAQAILDQHASEVEDSSATVNRFIRRLKRRIAEQYGDGVVPIPHDRTLRRRIDLMLNKGKKGTFGSATQRRKIAGQPEGMHGRTVASRPGQVVILDSSWLDVTAYDPVLDQTVSLQITVGLDLATRSILAWRITPSSPKAVDATMMIADMLAPLPMRPEWQDKLRFAFMGVEAERLVSLDERLATAAALPVIYPEVVLVDNGKVFVADATRSACRRLGISIPRGRVMKATDKAHVERLFETIRTMFAEHVAGYKGRDVSNRGSAVEDTARWTIDEVAEFFAEFVVAVYQRRAHAGLVNPWAPNVALSPNDGYAAAVEVAGFVPCPTDPDLFYELLELRWRRIRPAGVQIDWLWYSGEGLEDYRNRESDYVGKGDKWPIRVDPRNRLHVYFKTREGTWLTLKWTKADADLQPFSDRMLKYAKQNLADRGKRHPLEEEVLAELHSLQNRMDAPEASTARDRRTLARERAVARAAARDRARAKVQDASEAEPLRVQTQPTETDVDELELDLDQVVSLDVFADPEHGAGRATETKGNGDPRAR